MFTYPQSILKKQIKGNIPKCLLVVKSQVT